MEELREVVGGPGEGEWVTPEFSDFLWFLPDCGKMDRRLGGRVWDEFEEGFGFGFEDRFGMGERDEVGLGWFGLDAAVDKSVDRWRVA